VRATKFLNLNKAYKKAFIEVLYYSITGPPQFPERNRPRLHRHQVAQRIRGTHFQNIFRELEKNEPGNG